MPRTERKHGSGSETIRKLTRTGKYSYYITLPKAYIDRLGWRERQLLEVDIDGDGLIIRDWEND